MEDSLRCDVAVVGAGPAGMMAAIAAAEDGASVILCEQLARVGAKLLATGGGRCNLTNLCGAEEFMRAFGRFGRFIQPALAAMDAAGLREFFAGIGLPTHTPDGVHVYPASNSAATVQAALLGRCQALKVRLLGRTVARRLIVEDGKVTGVETSAGVIACGRVIVASGGKSYPAMGGTGGGYALAAQAGHEIVEPVPALVGLVTREDWPVKCAGLAVSGCRAWIDLDGRKGPSRTGDVLFTHRGISGPAILDLSGDVAVALRKRSPVLVRLDPAGLARGQWMTRFDQWQHRAGARPAFGLLSEIVPWRLAEIICGLVGIDRQIVAAQLLRAEREKLAELLAGLPLTVTGTEGFDQAMVTRGGVSLKKVNPHTLESKLLSGLFFAGEVLDLDGPCGGYNLQWAFSSGWLAGNNCGRRGTENAEKNG